jgi:hypothetical protein
MRPMFALCLFAALVVQPSPLQKMQKAADDAKVQFAKEVEIIYKTQPPISYGWGVMLGFGLGIVFTGGAQWLDRRFFRK